MYFSFCIFISFNKNSFSEQPRATFSNLIGCCFWEELDESVFVCMDMFGCMYRITYVYLFMNHACFFAYEAKK